jgi:hypothetical protein
MTQEISTNDYQKLLSEIQEYLMQTQQKIIQQKIETAWHIGKLVEEFLEGTRGISYGKQLFINLERDTNIEKKALYKMRLFYKHYPTLPQNNSKLNWSHYRILTGISDAGERKNLERLITKNSLSVSDLQKQVNLSKKSSATKDLPENTQLKFTRGKLFTYPIKIAAGQKVLDLGFNIFQTFEGNFEVGDLAESATDAAGFYLKESAASKKQTHTYKAYLERIVDGDTIIVTLDLGFKTLHKEILRLAKINAPEKGTEGGALATAKLTEILNNSQGLVIKTNRTDIYGRYIADVFLGDEEGEYLNQMLVDSGLVEIF